MWHGELVVDLSERPTLWLVQAEEGEGEGEIEPGGVCWVSVGVSEEVEIKEGSKGN